MALDTIDAEDEKVFFLNDPKFRSLFFQGLLLGGLGYFFYTIVANTQANIEARDISTGFAFLTDTAGFGIIGTPGTWMVGYTETATYGDVYLVGLVNTLFIAIIGVFLATILGFTLGVMRLSKNWVVAKIAMVYVETFRNIPLLLQIFFWYFAVLRSLPGKRDKWSLFDTLHLNILGIWGPRPLPESGFWLTLSALAVGIIGTFVVKRWAHKRQMETGEQFPVFLTALGLIIGLPAAVFLITGMPLGWEYAEFKETGAMLRRGFQQGTGFVLIPEFIALLLALTIYTASFIAEIVRAGILAVAHGQTEASYALGLRPGPTLRLNIIPQAMKVIIPPLTSQYLNLTKNSSLAVAIAYPELVAVFAGTVLNQAGQAVEIIIMTMLTYLAISLVTSMFMNWYNARSTLVER